MNDPNVKMQIMALVTGVLIPLLVAALTKLNASSALKALANLFLSAVSGTIGTVALAAHPHWSSWLLTVAMTWGTSVVSYYGLHKPTGAAPAVASATAGVGVGGRAQASPPPAAPPVA